jgi:hypothetical protein
MFSSTGKTTVITPLLCLMLANGSRLITVICPKALLEMSRTVLGECFSVILVKRIRMFLPSLFLSVLFPSPSPSPLLCSLSFSDTLNFDRTTGEQKKNLSGILDRMFTTLERARLMRNIVICSPETIKSMLLKYIDLLQSVEAAPPLLSVPRSRLGPHEDRSQALAEQLHDKDLLADQLQRILGLFTAQQNGIGLIDEVDLILHPLKSELNFPIGSKVPLDLDARRWELPIFLLNSVFFAEQGVSALGDSHVDNAALDLLQSIKVVLKKGQDNLAFQSSPHLVLLRTGFYHREVKPLIGKWALIWLKQQQSVREALESMSNNIANNTTSKSQTVDSAALAESTLLCYLCGTDEEENNSKKFDDLASAETLVSEAFHAEAMKLVNLSRDWLCSYMPHCMSKIDRVSYGLLQKDDIDRWNDPYNNNDNQQPLSRQLLSVPFVGKDVPAKFSEFAHPDVLIGLTILGYRYEGLRTTDVKDLVKQLKLEMQNQSGPFVDRPARALFSNWLQRARAIRASKESPSGSASTSSSTSAPSTSTSSTDTKAETKTVQTDSKESKVESKETDTKQPEQKLSLAEMETKARQEQDSDGLEEHDDVLPLEMFQVEDNNQIERCWEVLKFLPEVIQHHLCLAAFPKTMNRQKVKLSACGVDIGSSLLFGVRLGFSGTPSDLLPNELRPCHYEPASEAQIVRALTSTHTCSAERVTNWTVQSLLHKVANHEPPLHALVDVGALITGLDNQEVARHLLRIGLSHMEAVVFLDANDKKVVVDRTSAQPVELAKCGVPPEKRFTFFDQVHTTGMDIQQALDAQAAVTLGKGKSSSHSVSFRFPFFGFLLFSPLVFLFFSRLYLERLFSRLLPHARSWQRPNPSRHDR